MSDSPISCSARNRLNVLPENPDKGSEESAVSIGRFPKWLHRKLPKERLRLVTQDVLQAHRLPTVCEEARCPNLMECWSKKTATFLAMGKECTRACGFCDIDFNIKPKALDPDEPKKIAESVRQLELKHVVITMVARDDLFDGGAEQLSQIISTVKLHNPFSTIEVLTSDFEGNEAAILKVLEAKPDIFNHNIETTAALSPRVRHKATYERTLKVLAFAKKNSSCLIKSGLMVGFGEDDKDIFKTIDDLVSVGCDIITIGQYLQASSRKLKLKQFITPEQFQSYADYGQQKGNVYVYSGPFVRSSYNAAEVFERLKNGSKNQ